MTQSTITLTETEKGFTANLVLDVDALANAETPSGNLNMVQRLAISMQLLCKYDPVPVIGLVVALEQGNEEMIDMSLRSLKDKAKELREKEDKK